MNKQQESLKLALGELQAGKVGNAMQILREALAEPDYKALYEKAAQQYNELAELMAEQPAQQRHISYVCPQCYWSLEEQPAQQQEPDLSSLTGQADAHLRALLRYTENFYCTAIEHGMKVGPTADSVAHVERAGKALHQIVHAQAKMLCSPQPTQQQEPVVRSKAYDMIDRFLQNNLNSDEDYAEYSKALDSLYTSPPAQGDKK